MLTYVLSAERLLCPGGHGPSHHRHAIPLDYCLSCLSDKPFDLGLCTRPLLLGRAFADASGSGTPAGGIRSLGEYIPGSQQTVGETEKWCIRTMTSHLPWGGRFPRSGGPPFLFDQYEAELGTPLRGLVCIPGSPLCSGLWPRKEKGKLQSDVLHTDGCLERDIT
jgi:hypothetical protein